MRVVLDTNLLISTLWKADGLEARTVALALAGTVTAFVSAEVLAEYRDVLFRPKFAALRPRAEALLRAFESKAVVVRPTVRVAAALDEDDNRLIECAFAADALYLVTGNLRHFPPQWGKTKIVNARQFLNAEFSGEL